MNRSINSISIVVDLTFGDCGKGMLVDNLCASADNPLVVRYTGGAQAGHNVVLPKTDSLPRVSHIHSTFGSGALRGAPSFFSKHTSFFPPKFVSEREVLRSVGREGAPVVTVDPLATLVTPYDVAFNRAKNHFDGGGTCGLGIGAAMYRQEFSPFRLFAVDLRDRMVLANKLGRIGQWYRREILPNHNSLVADLFANTVESYVEDYDRALDLLDMSPEGFVIGSLHRELELMGLGPGPVDLILEGAQGVMLDRDHGIFPDVTFGHTTTRNAWEIIEGLKPINGRVFSVDVVYGSRCYQTRHGRGPMTTVEISDGPLLEAIVKTETNFENPYQGPFRVGEIDYDLLNHAIDICRAYQPAGVSVNEHLAVTCLDHRPNFIFDFSRVPQMIPLINTSPEAGNLVSP